MSSPEHALSVRGTTAADRRDQRAVASGLQPVSALCSWPRKIGTTRCGGGLITGVGWIMFFFSHVWETTEEVHPNPRERGICARIVVLAR